MRVQRSASGWRDCSTRSWRRSRSGIARQQPLRRHAELPSVAVPGRTRCRATGRQLVARRPAEEVAGLVARRRNDLTKLPGRIVLGQKPLQPLARDDAAIEVAGDPAPGRGADLHDIGPRRPVCRILLERVGVAHHRGDAIDDLVAGARPRSRTMCISGSATPSSVCVRPGRPSAHW